MRSPIPLIDFENNMSPQKANRRDCRTAVMYARVSPQEQAKEGFSIPAQDKLLRNYAEDHHLEICAGFIHRNSEARRKNGLRRNGRLPPTGSKPTSFVMPGGTDPACLLLERGLIPTGFDAVAGTNVERIADGH